MQIIFVNGRAEHLGWHEVRDILFHRATLILFALGVLAFEGLPITADLPDLSPRAMLLFWAHIPLVFFGTYLAAARWCERSGRTLWTPALLGLIALLLTATGKAFYAAVGLGRADLEALAVFWLALWAMLALFELVFMTLIYDRIRNPAPPRPVDPAEPIRLLLVTGRRLNLTLGQLQGALLHPAAVGLTLAMVTMLFLFHPYPPARNMPLEQGLLIWSQALAGFYLLFFGLAWLCRRFGLTMVVPLALLAIAAVLTLSVGQSLHLILGVVAAPELLLMLLVFNWTTMVLTEFLLATFLIDRLLPGSRQVGTLPMVAPIEALGDAGAPPAASGPATTPPAAPTPAPDGLLRLQGFTVPMTEVLAATAEEHYIRIVTPETTRLLRGRIADVDAQMPAALGMRVHRSHWVARRAVTALRRSEAGWTLALVCGREMPVARGRQAAVRAWIEGPNPEG